MILAQRDFRTGKQTLLALDGRFFMDIVNRSYRSRVEVPAENVPRWKAALTKAEGAVGATPSSHKPPVPNEEMEPCDECQPISP